MYRPLAFSTLGCPGASITEICALARRSGWHAVELRTCDEEAVRIGLDPLSREAVRSAFSRAGVRIVCLASYVRVGDAAITDQECLSDLLSHLALARDVGAGAVRVFPGAGEATPEADTRMTRRMLSAADSFAAAGVALLLETHDSHRAGADIARVLEQISHPAVGAIWDILHTWLAGEPPAETGQRLAPWLRHVQLKNVASDADLTPTSLGAGIVPVADVLAVLDTLRYRGYLSLEWERRWHPLADPLPTALADARAWLETQGLPARPDPE